LLAVGAFKTVGYSRVGKVGGPNPYGRAHKNYSLVTVSSREDVPVYAEAFGIPEDRVVATGIPRTDRFFDPAHGERARELALAAFPEARGRTTILFAPTFRGTGAWAATYDLGRIDVAALHALCVERDAVCIVRMHPFVREPLRIAEPYRGRILDGQRSAIDVNDLLFAVDLLVTDYSSIVYEFSTLGRPMLFYAWDLDEYAAGRDTYEPYETFVPGRIVRTFPELLEAIRREDYEIEKVAPFAERHFEHRDGRSTDRVVDLVLGR
jgi:CDP-ribitol ribitolphosphotransferase